MKYLTSAAAFLVIAASVILIFATVLDHREVMFGLLLVITFLYLFASFTLRANLAHPDELSDEGVRRLPSTLVILLAAAAVSLGSILPTSPEETYRLIRSPLELATVIATFSALLSGIYFHVITQGGIEGKLRASRKNI